MSYAKCSMGAADAGYVDAPPATRGIDPVMPVSMAPPVALPATAGQLPMTPGAAAPSSSITPFTMLAVGGLVAYFLFFRK